MDNASFEKYQHFTEQTIANLSNRITTLEEKLNVFTNLLAVSQYVNQYIKTEEFFPLIADTLIGVFGAKYATIYLKTNGNYLSATPSKFSFPSIEAEQELIMRHHEESFIINSETPIYMTLENTAPVFSCLGVPITLKNDLLGFIIIAHEEKNYFSTQHTILLSSLATHISISIENNLLYNKIKETANLDGLTGIFNKRYFFDTLNAYEDLDLQNYTIAMIDIDCFKTVNDTYGHLFGDTVLKKVTQIIQDNIRPTDIAARYGGEEIIIFFKNFTNATAIKKRLEAIRHEIEQTPMIDDENVTFVTASLGAYIKYNEVLPLKEAITRADANLYISKALGRNHVHMNTLDK